MKTIPEDTGRQIKPIFQPTQTENKIKKIDQKTVKKIVR